ncbi:hypothetical protein CAPTEDRAFT_207460 [Capitella teleta]|uniref:A-kinase anchor protein 7-like phosphoesterase domain-containing protein n=1 Tax=Capitella teleta TaxID=283909 RepID=R7TUB4_CAPTE|nr:hypothetical protein CAPTEDRAFT_207460 [Capitella teleta]|eukprot:ELT94615.1 hypothetical protein CAPTEDRAFT_207460 [Capitella teleta]
MAEAEAKIEAKNSSVLNETLPQRVSDSARENPEVVSPSKVERSEVEGAAFAENKDKRQNSNKGKKLSYKEWKKLEEKRERKKEKKVAPNHFISLQVTNPEIIKNVESVHQEILSKEPRLETTMVSIAQVHFTLMVMHLSSEDDINRAKSALLESRRKLDEYISDPLTLTVQGVGRFSKNVVFAGLKHDEGFDQLKHVAGTVVDCMADVDIYSTDKRPLNPHLTILKTHKARFVYKNVRDMIPSITDDLKDQHFGQQKMNSLQLCKMKTDKRTGYYIIQREVFFDLNKLLEDPENSPEDEKQSGDD